MPRILEPYAGMSVLVVDDNVSNTAFLHALLEQQGLQRVVIENDSRQVMRRMAEVRPDLVLLDLHMPHVDGYELLSQIQAFAGAAFLPVLVLTADTTVDARNRALGQGAQDFLTKPLDAVETCLRIGNLLQTRQLYSTLRYTAERSLDRLYPRGEGSTERMSRIQDVLRSRSITSVYQPVVDTQTLAIVGHEALSRFPQAQSYGPDRWFSDATAVGLGVDLEWLAASIAMQGLDRLPDDTFLAVNLSPAAITHLADEDLFAAWLCPRLVIEVTEHVPIEDYDLIDRGLGRLRELGARLSVDDVGAGYAGFRHLLRLRPDIIKLDISLVAGIHRSRGQRALTRALVSFADEVEAMIIAEGIENQDDLDTLKELHVPWAQGYFLGKPAVLDVTDALKPA